MRGQIIVGWGQLRRAGRLAIFLLVALLWSASSLAADRGALFKVTGNSRTLYLFGTMHVGRADFYPFEPRLAAALGAAPTLALEIDPTPAPQAAARAMQKYGLAPPGTLTPPALAPRLTRALRQAGIDPATLAPYKPWLIATMLAVSEFTRLGYDSTLAVDARLAALAREKNIKVIELESIDSQLALFDSLPLQAQWAFLDETVSEIESGKQQDEARQIAQAWATADRTALDAIAARLEADSTVSGRFMREVLLDGRNAALTNGIVKLMEREDNSVAAIGVLHLVGKRSVPALMRERGLTVEQIY
ncbi:MAG: TraB/GumN family protein [Massilia sp.]|nr:TraB/GumN family protein [Massilia sp.]